MRPVAPPSTKWLVYPVILGPRSLNKEGEFDAQEKGVLHLHFREPLRIKNMAHVGRAPRAACSRRRGACRFYSWGQSRARLCPDAGTVGRLPSPALGE